MSANRDKTQKFKFLYDNLYQIYQNEKQTDVVTHKSSAVIKVADQNNPAFEIKSFEAPAIQSLPIHSLKTNMERLNEIHERLEFMLGELNKMIKRE